jgi:chaperonin GroES|tara:strand:- start:27 stop:332 length:306 start_codon:yes stop_codon:yes gene_type:complete
MSNINVTKMKPLQDRVLVKREQKESTSKGGIYLAESDQPTQQTGVVISTGPGKMNADGELNPVNVKSGDLVFFAKYGGVEFNFENEEYIVMKEEDIIAVVE